MAPGWDLDSSMGPEKWWKSYLNKYYIELNEVSKWKLIIRFLLLIFLKLFIPLRIFIQGISMSVIGVAVAVILIGLYVVVMRLMDKFIISFLDRMLGITNCVFDKKEFDRDSLVKDFLDNFYKENADFREKNIMENSYGMDSGYDRKDYSDETINTIVYSNKQMAGAKKDAYKNFKVNNFIDAPAGAGKIQDIFIMGNRAFIHTEDSLFGFPYRAQRVNTDTSSIYLGTGSLFGDPSEIFAHLEEGQFGTKDPWASVNSLYGRIFVDREARKIYLFNGSGIPEDITMYGMKKFFRENLTLKIQEAFPDYCENTVGYVIGIDNKYDRILFTKIDYSPIRPSVTRNLNGRLYVDGKPVSLGDPDHFKNEGFTLSYYPQRKMWVSFHSYIPTNYLHDRYNLLSEKDGKFWRHNEETDYHSFYGIDRHHKIEFVVSSKALENFSLEKLVLDFEAKGSDGRFLNSAFERVEIRSPFMNEDRTIDLREADVDDLTDIYSVDETESRILFENGKLIIPDISSEDFPIEGKYVSVIFTLTSNDQELYTRLVASFTENWVTD